MGVIGSRGTFVIPAALRRKLGLIEGQPVIAEEFEDGVLIRRAAKPALGDARRQILEETAHDYAALASDEETWQEVVAERKTLEGTLMDGLDPNETWTEDGDVPSRARWYDGAAVAP